ncbi:hypothetical protein BLNAU_4688 [Blattamonas nauphoetae]|uniref:Uncharacterized protein n=1 Tax=Blattamonas nauphoetae TaxID=2049346 RepID=A0ABQ9Y9V2_9EUKA|nr:hypothetical protein BLNAU_4688 [Blattamonas nauphoetae]
MTAKEDDQIISDRILNSQIPDALISLFDSSHLTQIITVLKNIAIDCSELFYSCLGTAILPRIASHLTSILEFYKENTVRPHNRLDLDESPHDELLLELLDLLGAIEHEGALAQLATQFMPLISPFLCHVNEEIQLTVVKIMSHLSLDPCASKTIAHTTIQTEQMNSRDEVVIVHHSLLSVLCSVYRDYIDTYDRCTQKIRYLGCIAQRRRIWTRNHSHYEPVLVTPNRPTAFNQSELKILADIQSTLNHASQTLREIAMVFVRLSQWDDEDTQLVLDSGIMSSFGEFLTIATAQGEFQAMLMPNELMEKLYAMTTAYQVLTNLEDIQDLIQKEAIPYFTVIDDDIIEDNRVCQKHLHQPLGHDFRGMIVANTTDPVSDILMCLSNTVAGTPEQTRQTLCSLYPDQSDPYFAFFSALADQITTGIPVLICESLFIVHGLTLGPPDIRLAFIRSELFPLVVSLSGCLSSYKPIHQTTFLEIISTLIRSGLTNEAGAFAQQDSVQREIAIVTVLAVNDPTFEAFVVAASKSRDGKVRARAKQLMDCFQMAKTNVSPEEFEEMKITTRVDLFSSQSSYETIVRNPFSTRFPP